MSISSLTVGSKIKYKIVLLGDQYSGKTAVIDRFINEKFEDSYNVNLKMILAHDWNRLFSQKCCIFKQDLQTSVMGHSRSIEIQKSYPKLLEGF
jgi:GTPase SAR1 family protein